MKKYFILVLVLCIPFFCFGQSGGDENILYNIFDPGKDDIAFYWKNDRAEAFQSLGKLKDYVETQGKKLIFATNGGMYDDVKGKFFFPVSRIPTGLYIENGVKLSDTKLLDAQRYKKRSYNYDLSFGQIEDNGVFYITKENAAFIEMAKNLLSAGNIKYATQSGPILVWNGEINPNFTKDSKNKKIRDGVGIMNNGHILFAMSKKAVNFYDFANFFKDRGCQQALFLDGDVVKTYSPFYNWVQLDGNFAVIIGVTTSAPRQAEDAVKSIKFNPFGGKLEEFLPK